MPNSSPRLTISSVENKIRSWLLHQHLPVFGVPVRRAVAQHLLSASQAGDENAARSLVQAWINTSDPLWSGQLSALLIQLSHDTVIDPLWEAWAQTRHPFLLDCVTRHQKTASKASHAFTLSALILNQFETLQRSRPEGILPLVQTLADPDASLREKSLRVLLSLQREDSIQELCLQWLHTRSPELELIIAQAGYMPLSTPQVTIPVALKFNHPEVIAQTGADQIDPLLSACRDVDPQISERARVGLLSLQNQAGVTVLCERWATSRDPFIAEILVNSRYLAAKPFPLRLLTALKAGRLDIAGNIAPTQLKLLLDVLKDPDPDIVKNAQLALENLAQLETRASFCQYVLDTEDPLLREIAIKAAYVPAEPDKRALFLFLTRQWSAYDSFDYDHRHLRLVYTTAPSESRQRISRLVQQVGRTDYLNILAGLDLRQVSAAQEDVPILIRILTANREWGKLWDLVGWVDLPASVEIVRNLSRSHWKPQQDLEDFDHLAFLTNQELVTGGPVLFQSLPPAVRRSVVKVNGRINDVNFHPSEPVLAVGTSHPRLVLWDFQKAKVTRAIDGFQHSINLAVFGSNGTLFCGQRGNTRARCSIYAWKDGQASFFGGHTGSVTSLLPVNETQLLSTGRDQQVILWDVTTQRPIQQTQFEFWARSAALSTDGRTAVLLHSGLNLLSMPDLTPIPHFTYTHRASEIRPSVARCASFSPDGTELVTGQFNGQVIRHIFQSSLQRATRRLLVTHPAPIEGLHFLPSHNLLVTACADGLIAFTDWPSGKPRGSLMMHTHRLTSLHISPDGAFMATGGSEASMVLWDLRVLDLTELFASPISRISAGQISVVAALAAAPEIPPAIRNALTFLSLLLQRRFRFDVQIAEAPTIQPGEFDILLQE